MRSYVISSRWPATVATASGFEIFLYQIDQQCARTAGRRMVAVNIGGGVRHYVGGELRKTYSSPLTKSAAV